MPIPVAAWTVDGYYHEDRVRVNLNIGRRFLGDFEKACKFRNRDPSDMLMILITRFIADVDEEKELEVEYERECKKRGWKTGL